MYAVIETGGKQYRVEPGSRIEVERLAGGEHVFRPVLVVDDGAVRATPAELEGVTVTARVVGEAKGPKIDGFTYKNKSNQRRRWGHRQHYSVIEITDIAAGGGRKTTKKAAAKAAPEPEPVADEPAAAPAEAGAEGEE